MALSLCFLENGTIAPGTSGGFDATELFDDPEGFAPRRYRRLDEFSSEEELFASLFGVTLEEGDDELESGEQIVDLKALDDILVIEDDEVLEPNEDRLYAWLEEQSFLEANRSLIRWRDHRV